MKQLLLKLKLLVWKNITLKRRRPVVIAIEIFCPLALAAILSLFRLDPNTQPEREHAVTFAPRALPSAGLVPFLQGIMCDPNVQLGSKRGYWMENDKNGFVNLNPNVSEIIGNLTEMLNDPHIGWSKLMEMPDDIQRVSDDWKELLLAWQNRNDSHSSMDGSRVPLTKVIINETQFKNFLQNKLNLTQSATDSFMSSSLNMTHLQQTSSDNTASLYDCLVTPFTPNTADCHLEKTLLADPSLYRSSIQRILQATRLSDSNALQGEIQNLLVVSGLVNGLMLCDEGKLGNVFEFQSEQDRENVEAAVCGLTVAEREELARELASQINMSKAIQATGSPGSLLAYQHLIADTQKLTTDYQSVSRLQFYATALYKADPDLWELQPVRSAYRGDPVDIVNRVGSGQGLTKHPDKIKHNIKCRLLCGHFTSYCKTSSSSSSSAPLRYASGYEAKGARDEDSVSSRLEKGVKILYAPQTPVIERVIHEANRTMEQVASLGHLAALVANYTASLERLVENLTFSSNSTDFIINQICNLTSSANNDIRNGSISRAQNGTNNTQVNSQFVNRSDASQSTEIEYCDYWQRVYPMLSNGKFQSLVSLISTLAEGLSDELNDLKLDVWVGFPNETSLDAFAAEAPVNDSTIWAGVVFTDLSENGSLPSHVQYKIKMNKTLVFNPGQLRDRDWRPGPRDKDFNLLYEVFGFVYIQDVIDRAIINVVTNTTVREPGGYLQQFPYPCYNFDRFARSLYQYGLLSVALVFSWVFSVAVIIRNVVYEKEQRLKEMMKIMGVSGSSLWISWFITSFLSVAISSLILSIILKFGKVFIHSNFLVILLFFLNYGTALVMMCFVFSTLFNRANLAAVSGGILYLVTYIPFMVYRNYEYEMGFSQKGALCLVSTTAFASACNYVARWEEMGDGLQWYNIGESTLPEDSFSFLSANLFIAIDTLIYAIVIWYIDGVFPGQYGIPRRWYFPLQPSYWWGNKRHKTATYARLSSVESPDLDDDECVENVTIGVSIRNLVKIYEGGKVAVDDLTLDLFEGQITCLLGRNGAGKTTTMSVLTGLFPPTSGVVRVLGKDVQTEIDSIRKELGFCPQHNVLFNKLTVEEHLLFFLAMKAPLEKRSEINEKIKGWLNDLSLTSKRKTLVSSLSGGMKRKLSVALAFVGGSRLVVLDEPTAGIDPYARRGIWDLLARHKDQRTIVLSTHYMDEADILGDRVAIISDGKLCFFSTPLAFKCRFSTGYRLTLVKQHNLVQTQSDRNVDEFQRFDLNVNSHIGCVKDTTKTSAENVTSLCYHGYCQTSPHVSGFDISVVTQLVQLYVSNAQLTEDSDAEACYVIPATTLGNSQFSSLLRELDLCKERLGIASYGVSDSSFDQAFLSVTADANADKMNAGQLDEKSHSWLDWSRLSCCRRRRNKLDVDVPLTETIQHSEGQTDEGDDSEALLTADHDTESQSSDDSVDPRQQLTNGFALHWQCFKALLIKRFLHTKRDMKGFVCQVILPVIFIFVALLVEHFKPEPANSQIELSSTVYPGVNYFPLLNFQRNKSDATQLRRVVEQPCGVSAHYLVEHLDRTLCTQYMNSSMNDAMLGHNYSWLPNSNCSCNRGRQVCPSDIAFPFPPSLHTIDGITIQDLGDTENMTDYLMKTVDAYELHRYGGLTVGNENTQYGNVKADGYHKQWIEMLGIRKSAKAWFNNRGYHSSPIYINVMNNAILRANLNKSDVSQYGITTYSDPFSWTASQVLIEKMQSGYDFAFAIFAMIALSFIPPTFIMFLIQERASGAKHQQKMSGLHPLVYWTANLTWDLISYLLMVICLGAVFLAFQDPVFTSSQSFSAVLVLFVSYGWAMTPLLYLTTFIFQDSSLAYVSMLSVSVLSGLLTTIASAIMQFLQQYNDSYDGISSQLHQVFLVFPSYCLGQGLVDIAYDYYTVEINKQYGDLGVSVQSVSPFSLDEHAIGTSIAVMMAEGIACVLLVVLVEYRFFAKYWLKSCKRITKNNVAQEEDDDVSNERSRVMNQTSKDAVLQLVQLTKIYNSRLRAVDDVCLSVSKGECFGLLGVNGAGKTTIFRMLTGDLPVTQGDALILGHSVVRNVHSVRHQVGYCPQFDAINDLLTGKEHLMLYARLRGIAREEIQQNVKWCLCKLALSEYGDVMAGKYSGGNKRKLSTAIALIGRPQVILLDEPTTGMDPSARRFLWEVIRSLTHEGHSIILTSHSMEECEAVCTRMGILVNGRFMCLGSSQHLKARYGHGYTIRLRARGNADNHQVIEDFFRDTFPSSKLKERHHNMLQFELLADNTSLSRVFAQLENRKADLNIDDYSISQTTLDSIFLGFAKQQRDGTDECEDKAAMWGRARVRYHVDQQCVHVHHPSDESLMM